LLCWIQRKSIRKNESKQILDKFVDVIKQEYTERYNNEMGDLAASVILNSRVYKNSLRLTSSRIKNLLNNINDTIEDLFKAESQRFGSVDDLMDALPLREWKNLAPNISYLHSEEMAEIFQIPNPYFLVIYFLIQLKILKKVHLKN